MEWENELRDRLGRFDGKKDGLPVSIKVRACGGCYDRSCCPAAHEIIDEALHHYRPEGEFEFVKHESGPEILVFCAVATAGFTFATAVINFVTAIINARTAGQKKGDHHHEPLELIVRGFKDGKMFEETVLHIQAGEELSSEAVAKALNEGVQKKLPALPGQAPKSKAGKKTRKVKK